EACLAIKLAQVWPKQRILNSYLNEVFYGRAAHGAQAAAETFFSTRAQDLSLAQAAMLAGLPQAPTVYDPMRPPAMATQRRGYVTDGRKMKFTLATQSTRTAGSSFKPFVLATALQHGISLYSSFSGPPSLIIPDRSCYGPQGPWDVHNFADESAGYMNLLSATANSV